MKDAVDASGASNSIIKQCLDGKYSQAGGFQWKYGTNKKIEPYVKTYNSESRYKPVSQYSLNGNLIRRWNSAKEAAEHTDSWNMRYIRSAAKDESIAYGYIWKYE